jgi:deoxycytidylate deaminase
MIDYPYLPEGKQFQYVPFDHPHMIAAEQARKDCAGDSLYPVGIVLVKNGEVVARAGNGFNRGGGTKHVCPRVVLDCPSGTGYELCSLHDSIGHAETMLMQVAAEQGIDINGSDTYMFGHWWCCEHCWKSMIDAGVRNVYVVDDAHERFSRDRVFAETLTGSRTDLRLEQNGTTYHVFVPESVKPVFTFEADAPELATRRFENVRKQL